MPRLIAMFLLLSTAALSAGDNDGFTPLISGHDLAGWTTFSKESTVDPKGTWAVKDGVITCTGQPFGYIATAKE